jgi:phosphate transport system substrate-binding protein
MRKRAIRLVLSVLACAFAVDLPTVAPSQAETIRIGGTGIGLAAMRRVGESLIAKDPSVRVDVLPSLGTPGGIRALIEREIDIAISARPLRSEERVKGVGEAACLTTALVFASSHPSPSDITRAELPNLYSEPAPTWPDGMPLKVILRSRAGSENPYLMDAVPGMAAAFDKAYRRPGMPIGVTDQENAELAARTVGSFAIMTLLQIRAERLDVRPLRLDGVAPTSETVANKTYPFPLRVCALLPANPSPAATRFIEHLKSSSGQALLRSFDAVPSD